MNKKLSIIVLATSASLLLSSCMGSPTETLADKEGNILLTTSVEVSKMPSWEKSSTAPLEAAGFTITPIVANELQKNNKDFPAAFSATNKSGTCNFEMLISVAPEEAIPNTEDFTTREYVYNKLKLEEALDQVETTQNIKVQGSKDKLEMVQVTYNYPNKVYPSTDIILLEGESPNSLPNTEPTIEGKINTVSLTRLLTSSVSNPFYIANPQIDENDLPPGVVGKTGRPVVTMVYSCLDKELDMKLWDSVVNSSTLSLPIVKK